MCRITLGEGLGIYVAYKASTVERHVEGEMSRLELQFGNGRFGWEEYELDTAVAKALGFGENTRVASAGYTRTAYPNVESNSIYYQKHVSRQEPVEVSAAIRKLSSDQDSLHSFCIAADTPEGDSQSLRILSYGTGAISVLEAFSLSSYTDPLQSHVKSAINIRHHHDLAGTADNSSIYSCAFTQICSTISRAIAERL